MAKWIQFNLDVSRLPAKTQVWTVSPQGEPTETLGQIKWYGAWRKYCFFPQNGTIATYTVFEWDCLRDIAQFCEDATKLHKQKPELPLGNKENSNG